MPDKTYPEFLHDMGELLQQGLPRVDRERDELFAAEAEVRRLKTQLAVAEERQSLARERYGRERAVFREVFDTWRDEAMKVSTADEVPTLTGVIGEGLTLTPSNVP